MIRFIAIFAIAACGRLEPHARWIDDSDQQSADSTASRGIHGKWEDLPIRLRLDEKFSERQALAILSAANSWNSAVEFSLVLIETDRVRSDTHRLLDDDVNSVILQNDWCATGKEAAVIGTTFWQNRGASAKEKFEIIKGDVLINSQFYLADDAMVANGEKDRPIVDLESLALHELGHLIGLDHVNISQDSTSIMHPNIYIGEGLVTRKLSVNDVRRIRYLYVADSPPPEAATPEPNMPSRKPNDPSAPKPYDPRCPGRA